MSGNSWTLKSPADGSTIQMAVQSTRDFTQFSRATVSFGNPWFPFSFVLRKTNAGIQVEGFDYPGVSTHLPKPAMMFGEGNDGQSWTSGSLSAVLVSSDNTVSTPAGTYFNARRYDVTFADGSVENWFLADGVGFVQFGIGPWAYQLVASKVTAYVPPVQQAPVYGSCPKIGLEANPPANGDFSAAGKDAALASAVGAGSNFMTISAPWAQLEPTPYVYVFDSLRESLARSSQAGLDTSVTIKTIDTTNAWMPPDLQGKAWDDPLVVQRFRALLVALAPLFDTHVKWLNLGNEVDLYLTAHPEQALPYKQFLQAGMDQVSISKPGLSTGVVFAFDAYHANDWAFRTLSGLGQHVSFTYYGSGGTAALLAGDPANAEWDIADIVAAANGRPVVLNEAGYSSATQIGSSPQSQQIFYSSVFQALKRSSGQIKAASYSFMSDFPAAVSTSLATQYAGDSSWTAWVGKLGLFDDTGMPKPAWQVFRTQAATFAGSTGCTTH